VNLGHPARVVFVRSRDSLHRLSRPVVKTAAGVGLVLLLLVLTGTAAADGSVLFVDRANPSCSDAGSGSASQPFCTVGAAAGRVSAGQTVQVAAGTYSENVTVPTSGTSTAPITFTAAPGASVVLSGQASGFTISGRGWITVKGFTVTGTSGYGISVTNSAHITLSGNHVSYSGQPVSGQTRSGIRLGNVTDSLVSGNTADHNSYAGIELNNASTGNEVKGNVTFNNARGYERAAPGIRLYGAPGNIVDGNVSHHNEDSGIEAYPGSNNSLIYNNVTYNNGDHGIDDLTCTGQRIIANTAYKNVTAGINVEGNSTGATLANNISVDNGIKSPRTHSDIRIEAGSTAGTTMDYDLVYLTVPDTILIWNSTSYSSLAAFRSASGQEAHGIQADPLWASASAGDFHLTAGSPAIDSANSGASGQPTVDTEGNARIDDPGTQNTGIGPRAYDDRGAYELQTAPPPDAAPNAALTVNPSTGVAPVQVTADASASTDQDATPIATYTFDFGDGSPAVGPQAEATATHTYTAPGSYTVTVTVTDTGGLSSTASAHVGVTGLNNLVGNPGFESALSGWNTAGSGSNISLARVAGGHSGGWAAMLTNTGTTPSTCTLNDSPDWAKRTSAGTYTGSIWVRADTPGATLKLRFREWSGSTLVGTQTTLATLTTSWAQVTVAYATQAPGSSTLDFNAYVSNAVPGSCFYTDDASIYLG
jgi:parallel beta-helix repeat protein